MKTILTILSVILISGCAANAKTPVTGESIGKSQTIPKGCKILRVETHPKNKNLHRVYIDCPIPEKKISA